MTARPPSGNTEMQIAGQRAAEVLWPHRDSRSGMDGRWAEPSCDGRSCLELSNRRSQCLDKYEEGQYGLG